jgi:transposase
MENETDRAVAIAQSVQHDITNNNKSSDSDGEAAHAALAGFWHTYPPANADMSIRVTRAIRDARLQERERCVALVKDWIEDFGPAIPDRSVDSLKAILHDIENSE